LAFRINGDNFSEHSYLDNVSTERLGFLMDLPDFKQHWNESLARVLYSNAGKIPHVSLIQYFASFLAGRGLCEGLVFICLELQCNNVNCILGEERRRH
jgi:hypothetical protein